MMFQKNKSDNIQSNGNDYKIRLKTMILLYLSIHSMPVKRRTLLNVVIIIVLACILYFTQINICYDICWHFRILWLSFGKRNRFWLVMIENKYLKSLALRYVELHMWVTKYKIKCPISSVYHSAIKGIFILSSFMVVRNCFLISPWYIVGIHLRI